MKTPFENPENDELCEARTPMKPTDKVQPLYTPEQIHRRVRELANDITQTCPDEELHVVAILHGALVFVSDLIRALERPITLDIVRAASYDGTASSGTLRYELPPKMAVQNRHVLLVDDILDTGLTLSKIKQDLQESGALSVRTCVLLDKPNRRQQAMTPDFTGFTIDDVFVAGYGMDYNQMFRHLPYIGTINPVCRKAANAHLPDQIEPFSKSPER